MAATGSARRSSRALTTPPTSEGEHIMDDIEANLYEFISKVLLEGEEIDLELDTPLLEHRLIDSLNVEELMVHIHDQFGVLIEDQPPSSWGSIRKLGALVRSRTTE
jgi:geranyl diphosphate 2-C-methyltransferase